MLELPIIDAHVHLWDTQRFPLPWLADTPALNRPFGVAQYQEATAHLAITGMVHVEANVAPQFALLEAQWAAAQARHDPRLRAIVAAAPIEFGEQSRVYLEALRAVSPLIVGVRRNLQSEPDPAYCLRPDFIQGIHLLAAYGFSFDICIRHDQLAAVTTLARQCPEVSFILDHLGKPAIKRQQLDPWRDQLAAFAALPNVACKISGLVTEADQARWQPEDLAPYVAHTLAAFGPDRVLFASDWPVLLQAASYQRWAETLDALTVQLSSDHRRRLWGENARRWYRLPPATRE